MKKQIKTLTASLLAVSIIGTAGFVMADENAFGAKASAADNSYTLQEMLTYAIQDEYLAKAEYAAIIDEFDVSRPFTNIIRAEGNHIAELLPLFEAYKVPVPAESAVAGKAVIPGALTETFAIGVQAEKDNIAMYEAFLKQELPDDVRAVFENLRDGSINHLAAFERGVARDGAAAGTGYETSNPANGNANRGNRSSWGGNGQTGSEANDNTVPSNGAGRFWGNLGNRNPVPGIRGMPENCILS